MKILLAASIVALSDTTRPVILLGFIVGMFVIAGAAVVLGRRVVEQKQATALLADSGLDKRAMRGGDGTFSSEWLAETRNQVDEAPRQSWADVILSQSTTEVAPLPSGVTDFPVEAPRYRQDPSAVAYQQAVAGSEDSFEAATPEPAPVWGGTDEYSSYFATPPASHDAHFVVDNHLDED